MDFTSAQLEAICARGRSLLVSAGAGSGKTRVLTERLMEYMDPKRTECTPEDIDHFLIITFTRAAAGELRARITAAIADRLRDDPANRHLRRQILLCRNAQIGTIHSFCAAILREYAGTLEISPAFRILEEEKSERLRSAALERVLERRYENGSEDFFQLVDRVGAGRDDSRLTELILNLHANMQSHARPEKWAEEQADALTALPENIWETRWGRELMEDAQEEAGFWRDRIEEALRRMQDEPVIQKAYEKSFSETADALQNLFHCLRKGWDETAACFPIPFPRINGIRNNPAPELAEELKDTRDRCKKAMEKLSVVFAAPAERTKEDMRETAPEMRELLGLVLDLEKEFQRAKARANALDFSDLEHLSIKLLTDENGAPTETAKEISARFTEVMVDEYQDVSRVQDQIFRAVSRDGDNLFFVGDLKQSIYRFRLADPEIFNEKHRLYSENTEKGQVIHLQENFRSRPEILHSVNAVFCKCMSERLGNLEYGQSDMLIPGTIPENRGFIPELLLLPREEAENTDLEEEAALTAREILSLMQDTKIRGEEGERPIRFGDIAILHRSANAVGAVFRRVLLSEGIPVSAGAGGDFYGSVEVSIVFSMLSVMDNPHRDIPLLSLLSSPAYGFSAEKLSIIRASKPDTDFYSALCASDDADAAHFIEQLRRLRDEAIDLSPQALIERISEELDLYALIAAMPDGEQRIQHLMDLEAMAETFRRTGEYGLHRFVNWLRNMEKKSRDPETCTDGSNAVQILSIHRSKGLEFPVVFVCGLGRSFNRQDMHAAVLVHPELGLGPKRTDSVRKIEYPTAARRAIQRRLNRDMLSEEMRLLYVAMTRPKDRLYLTAVIRKADVQMENAARLQKYDKIPAPLLETVSAPVQWLLPAALEGEALRCRISLRKESEMDEEQECTEEIRHSDPEMLEILDRNLTFQYPFAEAEKLPSKLTATQLKDQDPDAAALLRRGKSFSGPDLSGERISAARVGTATHLVLQQIDFGKTDSKENIRNEIDRLREQRFLSGEEARAVDVAGVQAFFESELGRRVLHAEKVWREFRFSLLTEARELLPVESEGDKVLLQGVADCFFLEEGGLVLADYKTDRVGPDDVMARAEYYRVQLDTYAKALERIFRMPVKEKYLYFLSLRKTIRL